MPDSHGRGHCLDRAALAGLMGVFSLLMSKGAPRHRPRVGSAAIGTVYDMLNEDKRNAVEIIVRAGPRRGIPRTRTAICRILKIQVRGCEGCVSARGAPE